MHTYKVMLEVTVDASNHTPTVQKQLLKLFLSTTCYGVEQEHRLYYEGLIEYSEAVNFLVHHIEGKVFEANHGPCDIDLEIERLRSTYTIRKADYKTY